MKRPASQPAADADAEQDRLPSKTALKKKAHALQALGLALIRLPPERRSLAPMPETLRDAVEQCPAIRSREAQRRQLQLIGKLLRGIDPAPLQAAVDAFAQGKAADAETLHRIERWRDELIDSDEAITRWMDAFPDTDGQQLRNLIRSARREGAGDDPEQRQPKSYRQLLRMIRQATAMERRM